MRCKVGDLVVYVGLSTKDVGHIARVVRPELARQGPAWTIDPPLRFAVLNPYRPELVLDSALRPIRDNDGTDETLTWASKPESIPSCIEAMKEAP